MRPRTCREAIGGGTPRSHCGRDKTWPVTFSALLFSVCLLIASKDMVALAEAEKAALGALLRAKRGTRKLVDDSAGKLLEFFAAKGTASFELPFAAPATAPEK